MKKFLIIIFLLISVVVNATNYYVKNSGNNSNTGRSNAQAWATISKVNSVAFKAGDTIFFNKGDVWREKFDNSCSGSNGNPIVFSSYGTGNKPIITGANLYSGFADGGSNIWDVTATTEPHIVLKSKSLQMKVANRTAVNSEGKWYWTGNILSVYATSDPSGLVEAGLRDRVMNINQHNFLTFTGITFECANNPTGCMIYAGDGSEKEVKFYNCIIQYSAGNGLRLGSSTATIGDIVDNCTIRYNYGNGIASDNDGDVHINNCKIYSNGLNPVKAANGIGGLIGNYHITKCDVYDNGRGLTEGPPHGIYNFSAVAVVIENCTVHDQPEGSGVRLRTAGIVRNCAIYNNAQDAIAMDVHGTSIARYEIYGNLIYGNGESGINRGGTGPGTDVTIIGYNNTIYHTSGTEAAIVITYPIKDFIWENNIVYTDSKCLIAITWNVKPPINTTINHNVWYRSDDGAKFRWDNADKTFAQWQVLGYDINGIMRNPLFISSTDFHLLYNSSAINTGIDVGLTEDYEGNPIVGLPDIGAFEKQIYTYTPTPLYLSSVIQNASPAILEMTYNMTLTNIIPAASAFSVGVNSVARTVNTIVISGSKVQLTLASPIISGDIVTITYTKPSNNPLQTTSTGIAASISNQPVVNNCINVAPTAVITSPINNSSFTANANITITANAIDPDGSISMVNFYSGSTKIGTKSAAPYSFTWNNVEAGTYTLTVVATDNLNAITTSSAISISVINGTTTVNQPPVVTISYPLKGNKYENRATITIDAVASDPDGTISKVEFYSGAVRLFGLTLAPYTYTWKDVAAGTYTITAIATDNLNACTTSSPVELVVESNIKYDANSEIIKLYPNPNDGHFSIEFVNPQQNERREIILTDLAGKQVYNGLLSKEETIKQIDLSCIKSGIYILMIIYKEILVTKKIIKY